MDLLFIKAPCAHVPVYRPFRTAAYGGFRSRVLQEHPEGFNPAVNLTLPLLVQWECVGCTNGLLLASGFPGFT